MDDWERDTRSEGGESHEPARCPVRCVGVDGLTPVNIRLKSFVDVDVDKLQNQFAN